MGWHSAIASCCGFRGGAYPWRRRSQFSSTHCLPSSLQGQIPLLYAHNVVPRNLQAKILLERSGPGQAAPLLTVLAACVCRRQGNPGRPKGMERMSNPNPTHFSAESARSTIRSMPFGLPGFPCGDTRRRHIRSSNRPLLARPLLSSNIFGLQFAALRCAQYPAMEFTLPASLGQAVGARNGYVAPRYAPPRNRKHLQSQNATPLNP